MTYTDKIENNLIFLMRRPTSAGIVGKRSATAFVHLVTMQCRMLVNTIPCASKRSGQYGFFGKLPAGYLYSSTALKNFVAELEQLDRRTGCLWGIIYQAFMPMRSGAK